MVNALLWLEDTLRTGKMLSLSKDCFKMDWGLWSILGPGKAVCLSSSLLTLNRTLAGPSPGLYLNYREKEIKQIFLILISLGYINIDGSLVI